MKIYVVSSGDYSDYCINRIFSTREKAELWIGESDGYLIEEHDVDLASEERMANRKAYCAKAYILQQYDSWEKKIIPAGTVETEGYDFYLATPEARTCRRDIFHLRHNGEMFFVRTYSFVSQEHACKLAVEALQEARVLASQGKSNDEIAKLMDVKGDRK